MKSPSKIGFALFLIGFVWTVAGAFGQASAESLEARFRREAPIAWANLEKNEDAIDLIGVMTKNYQNNRQPVKFHFARVGPRMFLESASEKAEGWGNVLCLMGDRGFILDRRNANTPYAITHIGNNSLRVIKGRIEDHFPEGSPESIREFTGGNLARFLRDPHYHILGVEPVQPGGGGLVRLRYARTAATKEQSKAGDATGEAVFDPAHQWLVLSNVIRFPDQQIVNTTTYEYGDDEDGRPTLKKYSMIQESVDQKGTKGAAREVFEFTRFSRRPPPGTAFTLAGFGLPDLDMPLGRTASSPYNFWLLGLGLLFAVAAVVIRVRRSKPTLAPR